MSDPKDIFKKFGKSARQVLITSQRIAQNMNSGIGSEHFLLALTVSSGNLAYEVLKDNSINLDQVKLILSLNNIKTNLLTGLSKEAKNILVLAAKKAENAKNSTIESEHILWAILEDKNCRAYQIIERIGVEIKEIKEQIEEIFYEIEGDDDQTNNKFGPLGPISPDFIHQNPGFEFILPNHKQAYTKKTNSKTPYLDQYGTDLTKLAEKNKLEPIIGRKNELTRTIQILCRKSKNNPVLIGEPGVGKTSIVEGLAQKISLGQVPTKIQNKRIINLDLTMALAGTMYRGQFEERIKKIIQEVIKNKNIILFIDEIHTVVGAGNAEGSIDAANILKPSLSKGQIHLIGSTTIDEYSKNIEKDRALERRFQIVKINEPSEKDTKEILNGIKKNYEKHHQVTITDSAIDSAIKMSSRYISERFLPDKAIDLIDEASAAKQINSKYSFQNKTIDTLRKKLNIISEQIDSAVKKQQYQKAAKLKIQEISLKSKIKNTQNKNYKDNQLPKITDEDIAKVISLSTGIPYENLIQSQISQFSKLEQKLNKAIIGQKNAINLVSSSIKKSKLKLSDPNRPIGTFLFLGPTGVGKTELAKQIAKNVYTHKNSLIKLDMSEFMEKHNISRLLGAPPGYIGHENEGKLTQQVRNNPYSLILFDEIEKAHPEVFNILLQILEDGYLTDAKGRYINFRNTIIILTSNVGISKISENSEIGFNSNSQNNLNKNFKKIQKNILSQLNKEFRPELLNRIDNIIIFNPLGKKEIEKIIDIEIDKLISRFKNQSIDLKISANIKNFIAQKSYEPKFGAREIRRKIAQYLENPISNKIIELKSTSNIKIYVDLKNSKTKISVK